MQNFLVSRCMPFKMTWATRYVISYLFLIRMKEWRTKKISLSFLCTKMILYKLDSTKSECWKKDKLRACRHYSTIDIANTLIRNPTCRILKLHFIIQIHIWTINLVERETQSGKPAAKYRNHLFWSTKLNTKTFKRNPFTENYLE